MHSFRIKVIQWLILITAIVMTNSLMAQEADNEFSISALAKTRGELRHGGFHPDNEDNQRKSNFVLGQYRLNFNYKRSWLELNISPQWSGVWGQSDGSLSLFEGWILMRSKQGLFTQIGRQGLEYDDERIIGYDDWTMTAPTHDVVKLGYEGHGHKVHAIFAYNQNPDNVSSGTIYYSGGIQPYKMMQTLWYHYDTPKSLFGVSLIGMNIGMQNKDESKPKVYYQQLVGTYLTLNPSIVLMEGSFYYQFGKEEHGIPLDAFMGSVKVTVTPSDMYKLNIGYDYLSGDKYFAVPAEGNLGMVYHDKMRGFCPLFGSHHKFYGAMDFFYMDNYVHNFTPGLQNLYAGGSVTPVNGLDINATYHFFAIATNLDYVKKPLGHEVEFSAAYSFANFVKISAGYSFMRGTKTMEVLQHVSENRRLHWGWLMLTVSPTMFKASWLDKKNRIKTEQQANN